MQRTVKRASRSTSSSWRGQRLLAVVLAAGCDVEPADEASGTARLLAEVNVDAWCNDVDVITVRVRARPVACEESGCEWVGGPIAGDEVPCPPAENVQRLGVQVEAPGEYGFEVVGEEVVGEGDVSCLGGALVVTEDDLQAGRRIDVDPEPAPCPDP